MAKRKRSGAQKSGPVARLVRLFPTSGRARATLAVFVVGASAVVPALIFRDSLSSAKDGVITALGLGVIPVGLWLAVFLGALAFRRRWFRALNLWLTSLALVALAIGIMDFRHPDRGVLGAFTLDGEVSLGGNWGHAITGDVGWLGVFRLLGIFLVGVAAALPSLALDAAGLLGRVAIYGYLFLVLAVLPRQQLLDSDSGLQAMP